MPTIHVRGTAHRIPASPVRSILVSLQQAGVPIDTQCGGRAMCGRCAIRVLRGTDSLAPMRRREADRLQAIGADPDVRLACQSYARGEVEIEILNEPSPDSP